MIEPVSPIIPTEKRQSWHKSKEAANESAAPKPLPNPALPPEIAAKLLDIEV